MCDVTYSLVSQSRYAVETDNVFLPHPIGATYSFGLSSVSFQQMAHSITAVFGVSSQLWFLFDACAIDAIADWNRRIIAERRQACRLITQNLSQADVACLVGQASQPADRWPCLFQYTLCSALDAVSQFDMQI